MSNLRPSSSCFILSFFICSVALNLVPSLSATENTYLDCVEPFHCGNTTLNLSYPFWGSTRPSYCGHPRFQLNCSENVPLLTINSTTYRVIEINYDSQALRVARMDYWNDICPAHAVNSTMDFTLFNYTHATNTLILFYDCLMSIQPAANSLLSVSDSTDCDPYPRYEVGNKYDNLPYSRCGRSHVSSKNCAYYPRPEVGSKSITYSPQSSRCRGHASANITVNGTRSTNSAFRNRFFCSKRNGSASYYLLKTDTNLGSWQGLWGCKTSVLLPVIQSAAETIGNNSTSENLVAALQTGFGLRWLMDNATCEKCLVSGGACGSNPGTGEFACYCNTGSYSSECGKASSSKFTRWIGVVAGISATSVAIMTMAIILHYHKKRSLLRKQVEEIICAYSTNIPKRYSYEEVKKMTKSFKTKIGRGGYSVVYKGKLPNGQDVAVKLLNKSKEDMKDFMNEVASISKISHVNVITLLGFCFEWNIRVLIYEFMPKGSLEKYISHQNSDNQLNWNALYRIILGIARGLEYLHGGCNTKILHFDIKPHNILLDDDFCPKISDFGHSKQCRVKESHVSMTCPRGTPGFIAPEVYRPNFARVTHKSDVYSFGMLILEMVGQKRNPNEGLCESSEEMFPDWIYNDLQQSKDTNAYWAIMTAEEEEVARKMIIVGLSCIQTIPSDRPSMSDVIEMLGRSPDRLQIPPKPTLDFPINS